MFATIRRTVRPLAAVGIALAAVTLTAFAPGNARAAFNERDFSCTTTPFGVKFDFSGLGNTNLCLEGSVDLSLDCACAGGGGNCTSDAKKNILDASSSSSLSVEPKNGRASGTFQLPISVSDALCDALACPSGQDEKLVAFSAADDGATFTICTTTAPAGQPCTCAGAATQGDLPDTRTCPPASGTPFPGKKNSCLKLFQ
jgi:hypothetical protein